MSHEDFLTNHWQKKPLLIKGAIPNFKSPIDQDELAGLACVDGIHARLLYENGEKNKWQIKDGPFNENDMTSLPEAGWSLLVQEVDSWVEEVRDIRDRFRFIPDWRMDDVMVSFSPDQASVGAHVDHYDVFLLQGVGKKNWKVGGEPIFNPEIQQGVDAKILKNFDWKDEWVLEPGDMLYLPPEFAHHGVAIGNSMTYSIGFRSPSKAEVMASFFASSEDEFSEDFYKDPNLKLQENSSEITDESLSKIIEMVQNIKTDPESVRHWFGQLVTQSKRDESVDPSQDRFKEYSKLLSSLMTTTGNEYRLAANDQLRFAFSLEGKSKVLLFVNGAEYILDYSALGFVKELCAGKEFHRDELMKLDSDLGVGSLILNLFHEGYILYSEDRVLTNP